MSISTIPEGAVPSGDIERQFSLKYGASFQFEPGFRGPARKRSCTDVLCLAVFVPFLCGWVILAGYAFLYGHPRRLMLPVDSLGNLCGEGNFEYRPYLFYFDLTKCGKSTSGDFFGCPTTQVCVAECPTTTFSALLDVPLPNVTVIDDSPLSNASMLDVLSQNTTALGLLLQNITILSEEEMKAKLICKYGVSKRDRSTDDLVHSKDCAAYYLASDDLAGRCVPTLKLDEAEKDNLTAILQSLYGKQMNDEGVLAARQAIQKVAQVKEYGEMGLRDLQASWKHVLVFLAVTMSLSFVWIIVLQWLAGLVVWSSILIVLCITAFVCFFSFHEYAGGRIFQWTQRVHDFLAVDSANVHRTAWLAFGVVSGIALFLVIFVLVCLKDRLLISIAMIKEGSRVITKMPSSLLFSLFVFALQIGILAIGGAIALYLVGTGEPQWRVFNTTQDEQEHVSVFDYSRNLVLAASLLYSVEEGTSCDPGDFVPRHYPGEVCTFVSYGIGRRVVVGQVYNLFAVFWAIIFVLGLERLSMSIAFSSYYWAFQKPHDVPPGAVILGFLVGLRYHVGTVAFGSLALMLLKIVRTVCQMVASRMQKAVANRRAAGLSCWYSCCLYCIETIISFINKNAYVMVALHGKNFCTSAKAATNLVMRNLSRVVVIDRVCSFLLLTTKLVIVVLMGLLASLFFSKRMHAYLVPELNYYCLPVLLVVVCSYAITNCFFSVFDMAVETLFVCFLEDLERNDGSPLRPYYMSTALMKIFGKRNAFPGQRYYR